jgi:hypothetical protein
MEQSKNEVHGNLAGRDVNITHVGTQRETFMVRLHRKFELECASSVTFKETIDALQYFQDSVDMVPMGLQKKLELAGRQMDIPQALRAKELFAKCIARYSLSESAQMVIAYCLGKIHELFKANVSPLIGQGASAQTIDTAVFTTVIEPVLAELDANFLGLMPHELRGMVYYLTGNCFIDWHVVKVEGHVPSSP